jgi:SAM-dependent methyltransferase
MSRPSFDPAHDPFEDIYHAVGDDLGRVPWANLVARPELVTWLDTAAAPVPTPETRALVIACGLGDDAEELAHHGFAVLAFDFSPTAIALCRRRFPDSRVSYTTENLLSLPPSWARAFDLVVEVNTVQSLPPEDHRAGIAAIAGTVANGGALFLRCSGREDDEPVDHRPWPLGRGELAGFAHAGLVETSFVESRTATGTRLFVATYRRPARERDDDSGVGEEDTPIRTGV